MDQSTLIRSKNYLNLDDSTNDEQNHQLNLSAFSKEESFQDHEGLEIYRYVNVDTQTSLDYDDIFGDLYTDYDEDDAPAGDNDEDQDQKPNSERSLVDQSTSNDGRNNNADYKNDCIQEEHEEYCDSHEKTAHRNHHPATNHLQEHHPEEAGDNVEFQLRSLRDMLAIERRQNEQGRHNNHSMQQYLQQLQTQYLRLQRDLVEALELGHSIKAQKDAQLESISETVKDKDRLIEKLKADLENLETKLREEFNALLTKQVQLTRMEKQQMKDQINIVEQQLVCERVTNSQTLQQFQMKLDDQLKLQEHERELAHRKLTNLELELNKVLSEPQYLIIKELKEEKSQLAGQMEELHLLLDEEHAKYEFTRKRLENLLREQALLERRNRDEIDRLHEQEAEHRRNLNEIRLELGDKQEIAQILQFNLRRSEKRVKNLLGVLRRQEATFKTIISQLKVKHEQELKESTQDHNYYYINEDSSFVNVSGTRPTNDNSRPALM